MLNLNWSNATVFIVCLTFSQCIDAQRIVGKGNITKETRTVGAFTKISLESSADVEIMQGASSSVVIETYPNIAELIETVVENNTLYIKNKKSNGSWGYSMNVNKLKLYITNPSFEGIKVSGSGNTVAMTKISAPEIDIAVSGSGNVKIPTLESPKLKLNVTGSGDVVVGGNSETVEAKITGSGDVDIKNLQARSVDASVIGSGDMSCYATEKYALRVTGSGDIRYKKTNATVQSKTSGSGNISSN